MLTSGKADAQERAMILTSSNPINTGFYNSLGFAEKAQIVLGDDDPTWHVVLLVVCLLHVDICIHS
jgi:hypothetical protein